MIFAAGVGVGAGLGYLLDPDQGRRRRAHARDRVVHLLDEGNETLGAAARDVRNRGRGLLAEARHLVTSADAPDDVLAQRVRSKLGLHVSRPRAIQVQASNGRVTLRGVVLRSELDGLLAAAHRVRGVREVGHCLEVREEAHDAPAQQGRELPQGNWSPER